MATSTVEDYVKQVFLIQQELNGETAPMGRLSEALGITPGTTTTMVKALADDGLVNYEPRIGVTLTPTGRSLALGVLRRHRIAEAFLVQVLGMDWSEVHADAERLEHAISDNVLEKMDAYLNRPTHDPHGDPIPAVDGGIKPSTRKNLTTVPVGQEVKVIRVVDQSAEFLSYARSVKLIPGERLTVTDRNTVADSVMVQLKSGEKLALSTRVAGKIGVE
jgi:DtxR family transcriptional regulator, Mn-dependent transcriptional regulator